LAACGSAIVVTASGLGAAVPYAAEIGDAGQIPRLVGAAIAYLPAIWLVAAVASALYGVAPRTYSVAWVVVIGCFVIGFLGEVLKLPHWIIELSPFQHTPRLPAAAITIAPLVTMLAIAATLTATGVIAFRRRDIG
jgi:ABC-2 type transport system permease protein